ncbi:unnamed protein product [Gadus morhua 'NCC']
MGKDAIRPPLFERGPGVSEPNLCCSNPAQHTWPSTWALVNVRAVWRFIPGPNGQRYTLITVPAPPPYRPPTLRPSDPRGPPPPSPPPTPPETVLHRHIN